MESPFSENKNKNKNKNKKKSFGTSDSQFLIVASEEGGISHEIFFWVAKWSFTCSIITEFLDLTHPWKSVNIVSWI